MERTSVTIVKGKKKYIEELPKYIFYFTRVPKYGLQS